MVLSGIARIRRLFCFTKSDTAKQTREHERTTWDKGQEFLMSCIAMSVGLGNIWRFPFTAYENGGGAFLLPYIVCLMIIGKPIYYAEMAVGQFTSKESVKLFESLAPILKGIGIGQVLQCCVVGTYYSSVIAVTLYYLYNSFTSDLPWSNCKPEWENELVECIPSKGTSNGTSNYSMSSSELWYRKDVMKQITNIDNGIGLPDVQLTLCLFLSWCVIFLLTVKGIKGTGKAAYFLAMFPYVIIFTLLIRAVTLEGSSTGIWYFLNPQWEMLGYAKVWYSAVTQCFFSLSIGMGYIMMYSSYNHFSHNVYKDALIVTSIDTVTSVLAGIAIFGILGNLAHNLDVPVDEVISGGGVGLAFVSYPNAIANFDAVPWLFAVMFFIMLIVIGVGSMIALPVLISTLIKDSYPFIKDCYVYITVALIGFVVSIVYVTPGGDFVLQTADFYVGTFLPFSLIILEACAIFWWYGVEDLCLDIEFMSKRKVGFYWKMCWSFLTPVALILIYVYFLFSLAPLKVGDEQVPYFLTRVGWALLALGVLQPLLWWIVFLCKRRKVGLIQAIHESFSFSAWGPGNIETFAEWQKFKLEKKNQSAQHNWFYRKLAFFFK